MSLQAATMKLRTATVRAVEAQQEVLRLDEEQAEYTDGELASDEELASDGCKMRAANTDHSGDARVSDAELRAALEVVYAGGLDLHH